MKNNYAKLYGELHNNPKWFPGFTLKRYADDVAGLVMRVKPRAIIDYGSGKGYQYLTKRLHERWGGMLPYCYDPGVRQLNGQEYEDILRATKFDGLICTDVLEHIEAGDHAEFLEGALSYVCDEERERFAFFSVSCRPSDNKNLPDGRNVHLTQQPPDWWRPIIAKAVAKRRAAIAPGLLVSVAYETLDGPVVREAVLS